MLNEITGSPAAPFVYVSHNIHIIGKNHIKHCNIMLDGKGVPSTPPSEVRVCIYMYVTSLKIHLYV